MERLLVESAVRAVLIAAATAAVLWTFGIKTAAARHRAWTAVVVLMLLLPILVATGPKVSLEVLEPAPVAAENPSLPASNSVPGPAAISSPTARPSAELRDTLGAALPSGRVNWPRLLLAIYLLGACVMLVRLALGTWQAHKLIRSAVIHDDRLTSGSCSAPVTVGLLRPLVILPPAWRQWSKAQLDAVLTHEYEHTRRHDPLVQWLALLNRAVFWFHPLAWWLERRLAALAEGACDAAVLAAGHAPQDYSEYLLDLARSTMREGRRLSVVGMAMPGRYLTHRIRQIFEGVPMQSISRTRIACTVVLCSISSVVFAAATLSSRQVPPRAPKVAVAPPAALELAPQQPAPLIVQAQAVPAGPRAVPAQINRWQASTSWGTAVVLQNPPEQGTKVEWNRGRLAAFIQDSGAGVAYALNLKNEAAKIIGMRWPDAAQLEKLGLTDDQKARLDRTFEYHRQNIDSGRERLGEEEAKLEQLLNADPIDRSAVLTQLDRVIQFRGEMERADAAMKLELREYLTRDQWVQLQAGMNSFSFWIGGGKVINGGGGGQRGGGQQ